MGRLIVYGSAIFLVFMASWLFWDLVGPSHLRSFITGFAACGVILLGVLERLRRKNEQIAQLKTQLRRRQYEMSRKEQEQERLNDEDASQQS